MIGAIYHAFYLSLFTAQLNHSFRNRPQYNLEAGLESEKNQEETASWKP